MSQHQDNSNSWKDVDKESACDLYEKVSEVIAGRPGAEAAIALAQNLVDIYGGYDLETLTKFLKVIWGNRPISRRSN